MPFLDVEYTLVDQEQEYILDLLVHIPRKLGLHESSRSEIFVTSHGQIFPVLFLLLKRITSGKELISAERKTGVTASKRLKCRRL